MEPRQPGKKDMPDFKELNDRIIAEPSNEPTLVIKTNLDAKDATEENPYYQHKIETNAARFKDYFEDEAE
ncbi:hypothetical protein WD019_09570 [Fictibacillus sp. Mic-4]|uniref:hypothetical protein n=1 Tax=Fictibacillus TaxID=1329200 RepID=UPI0004044994|nr:hypothetical protein [Fictibacillus gelatini]